MPIASLYPLYEENDIQFDQKLLGTWVDDSNETIWHFARQENEPNAYQLTFYDDQGKPLQLNSKDAGSSGRRKIDLVDWDRDGDLDLLINSLNTALYRNIGREGEFVFQNEGDLSSVRLGGHSTSPTTVDWNGDGDPDLLIGAEDGFFYYLPKY